MIVMKKEVWTTGVAPDPSQFLPDPGRTGPGGRETELVLQFRFTGSPN